MTGDAAIHVLPAEDAPPRRIRHDVTARWLRAYAAAVGDIRPEFFDLERECGIVAHPVFPACLEWPLVEYGAPGISLSQATLRRGLHVGQEIQLAAPIRAGQRLTTTAELAVAEQRSTATHIATEFRTVDEQGALIVTSRTHMLYPGVRLAGEPKAGPRQRAAQPSSTPLEPIGEFSVDETNAVIYSDCARIFNPIHTDPRVAKAAGLPTTVLHGTETLARAVSLITKRAFTAPATVEALSCRFTGMVTPGTDLRVRTSRHDGGGVHFDVIAADGTGLISAGYLQAGPERHSPSELSEDTE